MTFDNALTHAIDYGKFIVQLWNYYIVLVVAMIGWLVTLRSKTLSLDRSARKLLIASYVFISLIFWTVLEQNHAVLIQLMELVHGLAQNANSPVLSKIYGPAVDGHLVSMLKMTSRAGLPVIVILAGLFMWFITDFEPETNASGPGKNGEPSARVL
jgi:hypothetical protein